MLTKYFTSETGMDAIASFAVTTLNKHAKGKNGRVKVAFDLMTVLVKKIFVIYAVFLVSLLHAAC